MRMKKMILTTIVAVAFLGLAAPVFVHGAGRHAWSSPLISRTSDSGPDFFTDLTISATSSCKSVKRDRSSDKDCSQVEDCTSRCQCYYDRCASACSDTDADCVNRCIRSWQSCKDSC